MSKKVDKYTVPISSIDNLLLEMGYQCNIRCSFCFQEHYSPKSNIDLVIWREKLLPIYPNLKRVTFHGGETTIMKEAVEFSDFIVDKYPHIKLDTTSNGLSFDKKWIDKFIANGHKIIFSLNAGSAETYNKVTKNSNWDKVVANVTALVKEKEKKGSDLIVEGSMLVVPENVSDIARFFELCDRLNFNKAFLAIPSFHQIKNIKKEDVLSVLEKGYEVKQKCKDMQVIGMDNLLVNLFPHPDKEVAVFIDKVKGVKEREDFYYDEVCKFPTNALFVNHLGDVSICCFSWTSLGNLYKNSIEEIWNGRNARMLRKKVGKGDYSLCKKVCSFNKNPREKGSESRVVIAQNLITRMYKDPKMALKKVKQELGRWSR